MSVAASEYPGIFSEMGSRIGLCVATAKGKGPVAPQRSEISEPGLMKGRNGSSLIALGMSSLFGKMVIRNQQFWEDKFFVSCGLVWM